MYDKGLEIRTAVMGKAYVDKALASNADDFGKPVQDYVTECAWGAVWGREGLPLKTRSLLNLAMLTALNRSHELGVHVRGALTNGATVAEIQETLLQTAVYIGVPAALEAFRVAEGVLAEQAQQAG